MFFSCETSFKLRDYQRDAVVAVGKEWAKGNRKTLVVLPTGCGKTIVFGAVAAQHKTERVLVLAHREELLEQAADKLADKFDLDVGIEKAERHAGDAQTIIASVQTLANPGRLKRLPEFGTVIIDEAHHALAPSYKNILDYYRDANVLGVTATPDRGDRRGLAEVFDSLAYEYDIKDAIDNGYLARPVAELIPLDIDLTGVKARAGDLADDDLGTAIEPYLEAIAWEMLPRCKDRQTVVFLPLVKTAKKFADILNRNGLTAVEVDGSTPTDERKQRLADFADGRVKVICNAMVLTEGWDCPACDCVVVLRPTKVRALYQQMIGRGLRPANGKDDCLLLDFLWQSEKLSLCSPSSLFGDARPDVERKIKTGCGAVDMLAAARDCDREAALAAALQSGAKRKAKVVDPLDFLHMLGLADYEPYFDWEWQPPTEKQLEYLERRHIDTNGIDNKGLAAKVIGELVKRNGKATPGQLEALLRNGFYKASEYSFEQAQTVLTMLSENYWRVPKGIDPRYYIPCEGGAGL